MGRQPHCPSATFTPHKPKTHSAFASPVWQQMGMHHVNIISGEFIGIQKEEAQRLCADLSAFYQDKDWQFEPLCESMWLLSMPTIEDWGAECVLDVCGQPEMDGQAHGKDAVFWLAMQTEIQMFLHTHPINQAREQQGLPEINGLWLWNDASGGTQSADIVASDSAWARFSDTPKLDAPYDLKAWFEMVQETGNTVSDGLIFWTTWFPPYRQAMFGHTKIFWKAGKPVGLCLYGTLLIQAV
ncbi:hypothetical protein [Neisseria mucosa]|uniref:hypothetical protein n=1 Tax=Neisseria mucosa TaxID=488 RepID=UPI0020B6601A|nr:hypothetical protein [Neisseria mucosa]